MNLKLSIKLVSILSFLSFYIFVPELVFAGEHKGKCNISGTKRYDKCIISVSSKNFSIKYKNRGNSINDRKIMVDSIESITSNGNKVASTASSYLFGAFAGVKVREFSVIYVNPYDSIKRVIRVRLKRKPGESLYQDLSSSTGITIIEDN